MLPGENLRFVDIVFGKFLAGAYLFCGLSVANFPQVTGAAAYTRGLLTILPAHLHRPVQNKIWNVRFASIGCDWRWGNNISFSSQRVKGIFKLAAFSYTKSFLIGAMLPECCSISLNITIIGKHAGNDPL